MGPEGAIDSRGKPHDDRTKRGMPSKLPMSDLASGLRRPDGGSMEEMEQFQAVRELFTDGELRRRLDEAKSKEEAVGVLVLAGSTKKVDFSAEVLNRISEVFASPRVERPMDKDLDDVAGMMADTHVHMSCCTDCPSSGALCC